MTRYQVAQEQAKSLQAAMFDKAVEMFGSEATDEALLAMGIAVVAMHTAIEKSLKSRFPTPGEMQDFIDGEL